MRIGVAGFEHETNTFAPVKADYNAFAEAKAYPPLVMGDDGARAQGQEHLDNRRRRGT